VAFDADENFFNADLVEVENEEDGEIQDQGGLIIEDRLTKVEKVVRSQEEKNRSNNLMMARLREESGTSLYRSKEDRIVISGITSKSPIPTDNKKRIDYLKKIAVEIFETLIKDFRGKIMFLKQGKSQEQLIPSIEVRLDSPDHASAIRRVFAEKRSKKELPTHMHKLFVTNYVNLATRVRIDIMKAIARKLSNTKGIAYVSGFISRPMMHIKKLPATTNSRPIRSYTFSDAITKYGDRVNFDDLNSASIRAGRVLDGQLEQNFVVLSEAGMRKFRASPGQSHTQNQNQNSYSGRAGPSGSGSGWRGGQGNQEIERGAGERRKDEKEVKTTKTFCCSGLLYNEFVYLIIIMVKPQKLKAYLK